MKYFTPELYERFNSRDIDIADRADTAWHKAEAKYKARLDKIRDSVPATIRDLADKFCLHDADVMAIGLDTQTVSIMLRLGNNLYWLTYGLTSKVVPTSPRLASAFSSNSVRWLYDEVDMPTAGVFSHEILLSDGQEIRLFFDKFDYRVVEVHPVGTRSDLERILRLADAVEASNESLGAFQLKLTKAEAQNAIAAAKRVKERPESRGISSWPPSATNQQFIFWSAIPGTLGGRQVLGKTKAKKRSAKP